LQCLRARATADVQDPHGLRLRPVRASTPCSPVVKGSRSGVLRRQRDTADTGNGLSDSRPAHDSAAASPEVPMKIHRARSAGRRRIAPARVFGIAFLITLAITCALGSGCGAGVSTPVTTPQQGTVPLDATPPVAMNTLAQSTKTRSLHDRVMAEQGRGMGATAASGPTSTTTVASGSQPIATPSPVPSVEPDDPSSAVLTGGQTPLRGIWSGTAEQLASFLLGVCPSPRFAVPAPVLAEYYVRYCA